MDTLKRQEYIVRKVAPHIIYQGVANGPVCPAMAGPIIEPVIKKKIIFSIYFMAVFSRNNKRGLFFNIFFLKRRRHSRHTFICNLTIRLVCSFCPYNNMVGQAVINIRWVHEEFIGLYSVPQTNTGTITTVTTDCVLLVEPTSEQVSQTVLEWSWQHFGQRTDDAKHDLETRAVSPRFEGHALILTVTEIGMLMQCAV